MDSHLIKHLDTKRASSDTLLYFRMKNGSLCGITGRYDHENLNTGDASFQELTDQTLKTFESKTRVYDNFNFFGANMCTIRPNIFSLNQERYIHELLLIALDSDSVAFCRARALLSRTIHSRPDFACVVNKPTRVTDSLLKRKHVADLNRAAREAEELPRRVLIFQPLEENNYIHGFMWTSRFLQTRIRTQTGVFSLTIRQK